ncbi:hypothetical protein HED60_17015 [Planctomycetales bacterium ZRK34]|nr:hypothetical protein HED60_17015 [Planctomycetales bacterium ZRK34]
MPTQVIASSLGLIGFIIAILAGLAADNPATTTLVRALGSMFICYIVGMIIGAVATRALNEHIEQYKQSNPMPANVTDAADVVVAEPVSDDEIVMPTEDATVSVEDDRSSRPAAQTQTTAKPRKGVAA